MDTSFESEQTGDVRSYSSMALDNRSFDGLSVATGQYWSERGQEEKEFNKEGLDADKELATECVKERRRPRRCKEEENVKWQG